MLLFTQHRTPSKIFHVILLCWLGSMKKQHPAAKLPLFPKKDETKETGTRPTEFTYKILPVLISYFLCRVVKLRTS